MTPGLRPLIAGNWKMHGTLREAVSLAADLRDGLADLSCDLLVCPPFPHLAAVSAALGFASVAVGAQDCHAEAKGARTGDVSAAMARDAGASFVLVGHSERRADHGETDALVRAKAAAALAAGLVPVVCVGETLAEREAGRAEAVVARQLAGSLPDGFAAGPDGTPAGLGGVVAYEPVWAIGTGRTPTGADVAAMHRAMRAAVAAAFPEGGSRVRLLYGGSVKPSNAAALLALPDVDGALVGGASLVAADFLAIARAAAAA